MSSDGDGARSDADFMTIAIEISAQALTDDAGGPFGSVVGRGPEVVGSGRSRVVVDGDPTAHAEMLAIRAAAQTLGSPVLDGTTLYSNCEPCPMCLAAAYWAGIDRIVYGNVRSDAASIGFADELDHRELAIPLVERTIDMEQLMRDEAQEVFVKWASRQIVA